MERVGNAGRFAVVKRTEGLGLKIAIVEDDRVHAAVLVRFLETWLREKNIAFCIREFPDAAAFLFEWAQNQAWDALFLDIQMPGLNGVGLAKRIRQDDRRVAIVFVTGITDYLLEGYEVEALHYLVKPVDAEKTAACMERIVSQHYDQERQRVVLTEAEEFADGQQNNHVTLRLVPEDILYIEAFAHNTVIYTKDRRYSVREGISAWKKRLSGDVFCTCHRSYLVNLFHVVRLEREAVVLDDGRRVPLSRRNFKEMNQAFIRFYSGLRREREDSDYRE